MSNLGLIDSYEGVALVVSPSETPLRVDLSIMRQKCPLTLLYCLCACECMVGSRAIGLIYYILGPQLERRIDFFI